MLNYTLSIGLRFMLKLKHGSEQSPETPHERRVTWRSWPWWSPLWSSCPGSSCDHSSLVASAGRAGSVSGCHERHNSSFLRLRRQAFPTATPQGTKEVIRTTRQPRSGSISPWTPVPGSKGYVKFLYYYVRPTQVTLGSVSSSPGRSPTPSASSSTGRRAAPGQPPAEHTFETARRLWLYRLPHGGVNASGRAITSSSGESQGGAVAAAPAPRRLSRTVVPSSVPQGNRSAGSSAWFRWGHPVRRAPPGLLPGPGLQLFARRWQRLLLADGRPVLITGISWFGLETENYAPTGFGRAPG